MSEVAETLTRLVGVRAPAMEALACVACGRSPAKLLSCGRCNRTFYCSASCQRVHWRDHRQRCTRVVCEIRTKEVVRRVGSSAELAETCLAVTGQRVDAACAVASALVSGNLVLTSDDELRQAFKLVFGTNVKSRHLRSLEAELPPRRKKRKLALSSVKGKAQALYLNLMTCLPGMAVVVSTQDHRPHGTVRSLVDYVYSVLRDSDEPHSVAAFLALVDELLTPPIRIDLPNCPMTKRELRTQHDQLRTDLVDAWADLARIAYPDDLDDDDDDLACAALARRQEKVRFHGAQRPDMDKWLLQPGHWLPKVCTVVPA